MKVFKSLSILISILLNVFPFKKLSSFLYFLKYIKRNSLKEKIYLLSQLINHSEVWFYLQVSFKHVKLKPELARP